MKNKDTTFLRRLMEKMDSDQLNGVLHEELTKDLPDGDAVRMALRILESREQKHALEKGWETEVAWEKYQINSQNLLLNTPRRLGTVLKAAAVLLVLVFLVTAIPQTARASGVFDRIVMWTDSLYKMFAQEDGVEYYSEYVFETDNPGLQQLYDTVVKHGETGPAVPMWMPTDYLMIDCEASKGDDWVRIISTFSNGVDKAVIQIAFYLQNTPSTFHKDGRDVEIYEVNGKQFSIMHNDDLWLAVWVRDNIECFLTLDCQEEELYRILNSVYSVEDK